MLQSGKWYTDQIPELDALLAEYGVPLVAFDEGLDGYRADKEVEVMNAALSRVGTSLRVVASRPAANGAEGLYDWLFTVAN